MDPMARQKAFWERSAGGPGASTSSTPKLPALLSGLSGRGGAPSSSSAPAAPPDAAPTERSAAERLRQAHLESLERIVSLEKQNRRLSKARIASTSRIAWEEGMGHGTVGAAPGSSP